MLKVSGLFVLLCGLLVPSSAQQILSEASSQITDALTQELLSRNFFSLLDAINLQGLLKTILSQVTGLLNIVTGPLLGDTKAMIQLQDPRLLQLSLHFSPDSKGVDLWIPFMFSLYVKLPVLNPLTLHVQTDIRVQLLLEKNIDGKYQLAFGHCRLLPGTIRIQSESLLTPTINFVARNIEKNLKTFITHDLGAKLCPFVNSLLYNLDLKLVNDLISLILQHGSLQVGV